MSECWHYIRFGTISDCIISGMHCTSISCVKSSWTSLDGGALDDGAEVEVLPLRVGHEVMEVGRQMQCVDGLVVVGLEHEGDIGAVVGNPPKCL